MRDNRFADRCFVGIVLVLMLGFMTGVAMALLDSEPRQSRSDLVLPVSK